MEILQKQMVERSIVVDVLCDRCGKSCMTSFDSPPNLRQSESGSFKADWGYFSNHDLESWTCVLCESCSEQFREWVDAGDGSGMLVKGYVH